MEEYQNGGIQPGKAIQDENRSHRFGYDPCGLDAVLWMRSRLFGYGPVGSDMIPVDFGYGPVSFGYDTVGFGYGPVGF